MTIEVKPLHQTAVADDPVQEAEGKITPTKYNAGSKITLATARLIGRTTAGAGDAEEISVGTGLTLNAGTLSVNYGAGVTVTQSTVDGTALTATGNGTGYGVSGTGGTGAGSHGVVGTSGTGAGSRGGVFNSSVSHGMEAASSGGNGSGVVGAGNGVGNGVTGTGGATGAGVRGLGGATSGPGGWFTATAGNDHGVQATGVGSGRGVVGTGGATGIGVRGVGGSTSGEGGYFSGQGGNATGATGVAHGSGIGARGTATSGQGVYGDATSGQGVYGIATTGQGVRGISTSSYGGMFTSGTTALYCSTTGTGLYTIDTRANTSGGAIIGYAPNTSWYGILGYSGNYSFYGNGMVYNQYDVNGAAIYGYNTGGHFGVRGHSVSSYAIYGTTGNNVGSSFAGSDAQVYLSHYGYACYSASQPAYFAGTTFSSDARLKENIVDADPKALLAKLRQLRVREFNWKPNTGGYNYTKGRKVVGLIAQEVQQVFPEWVTEIQSPPHQYAEDETPKPNTLEQDLGSHLVLSTDEMTRGLVAAVAVLADEVGALVDKTSKYKLFDRMTDAEVATFEQIMGQQSLKKRKLFEMSQYLEHGNAGFQELRGAMVQAFGAQRTNQLLAKD